MNSVSFTHNIMRNGEREPDIMVKNVCADPSRERPLPERCSVEPSSSYGLPD